MLLQLVGRQAVNEQVIDDLHSGVILSVKSPSAVILYISISLVQSSHLLGTNCGEDYETSEYKLTRRNHGWVRVRGFHVASFQSPNCDLFRLLWLL